MTVRRASRNCDALPVFQVVHLYPFRATGGGTARRTPMLCLSAPGVRLCYCCVRR